MENKSIVQQFLGLEDNLCRYESAQVAVVPAPIEKTTSFQHGTSKGPEAIINASAQVELYDILAGREFGDVGVHTLSAPNYSELKLPDALGELERQVSSVVDAGKWPLTLGGEHSISIAPIRALQKKYRDLSVLQIDAHADLRDAYEGTPHSHASVMRRVADLGIPAVAYGIRNYCSEEAAFIKETNYPIFHDHDIRAQGVQADKVSSLLKKNVYITIDIDGFTPGECPGTGTPEAGGVDWWQANEVLAYVFKNHNVVGADIVEVMPISSSARTEFFAAKLAYRMIGMKFFPESACETPWMKSM